VAPNYSVTVLYVCNIYIHSSSCSGRYTATNFVPLCIINKAQHYTIKIVILFKEQLVQVLWMYKMFVHP